MDHGFGQAPAPAGPQHAPPHEPRNQPYVPNDLFPTPPPQDPTTSPFGQKALTGFDRPRDILQPSGGYSTANPPQGLHPGTHPYHGIQHFQNRRNLPEGAIQANDSVRISRTWMQMMIGNEHMQESNNGTIFLKNSSEWNQYLPSVIRNWIADGNGEDTMLVPSSLARGFWSL